MWAFPPSFLHTARSRLVAGDAAIRARACVHWLAPMNDGRFGRGAAKFRGPDKGVSDGSRGANESGTGSATTSQHVATSSYVLRCSRTRCNFWKGLASAGTTARSEGSDSGRMRGGRLRMAWCQVLVLCRDNAVLEAKRWLEAYPALCTPCALFFSRSKMRCQRAAVDSLGLSMVRK